MMLRGFALIACMAAASRPKRQKRAEITQRFDFDELNIEDVGAIAAEVEEELAAAAVQVPVVVPAAAPAAVASSETYWIALSSHSNDFEDLLFFMRYYPADYYAVHSHKKRYEVLKAVGFPDERAQPKGEDVEVIEAFTVILPSFMPYFRTYFANQPALRFAFFELSQAGIITRQMQKQLKLFNSARLLPATVTSINEFYRLMSRFVNLFFAEAPVDAPVPPATTEQPQLVETRIALRMLVSLISRFTDEQDLVDYVTCKSYHTYAIAGFPREQRGPRGLPSYLIDTLASNIARLPVECTRQLATEAENDAMSAIKENVTAAMLALRELSRSKDHARIPAVMAAIAAYVDGFRRLIRAHKATQPVAP